MVASLPIRTIVPGLSLFGRLTIFTFHLSSTSAAQHCASAKRSVPLNFKRLSGASRKRRCEVRPTAVPQVLAPAKACPDLGALIFTRFLYNCKIPDGT